MRKKTEISEYRKNYKWDKCKYDTYASRIKNKHMSKEDAIEPIIDNLKKYWREYKWEKQSYTTFLLKVTKKGMIKEIAIKPTNYFYKTQAEKIGIHPSITLKTVYHRIHKGWDIEKACKTPHLWHGGSPTRWNRCVLE